MSLSIGKPSSDEKEKWRKTWTPEDLDALREIKRQFNNSFLVDIEFNHETD